MTLWPPPPQPPKTIDQPPHVVYGAVGQAADHLDHVRIGAVGQLQEDRDLLAVADVDEGLAVTIGPPPRRGGKPPPHAMEHVHDVFAGAQRVGAEVGTGTVRIAPLLAPQSHAIGLARQSTGDRIVGPGPPGVGGMEAKFLGFRPFLAFAEGPLDKFCLAEGFPGPVFIRLRG